MHIFCIIAYLLIVAQCRGCSSNYTNSKEICQNRGGLITQDLFKFGELINITCELRVNNGVLKDGKSVWVQGRAKTGPYIALHTCMRFSDQDKHSFVSHRKFNSNILFECSVFCDKSLHSMGYLGIYKDSCFCMHFSFRFPHIPECLEHDFMDIHKGIIVFRLIESQLFNVQSKSSNFNCLGASLQDSGKTSYYNTKCASTLYSICTQRVDSDLSNTCLPRIDEFCANEENGTFLEHYQKCWLSNGTLIPFNSGITVALNYSVILGSFRAFKAVDDDSENNRDVTWSCVSITKVNGTFYLETESCSNGNTFICMDDIQEASKKEKPEIRDGVTTYTVLILILVALLIIILFIVFYKCWYRDRRKYRGTLHYSNQLGLRLRLK